MKVFRLTATCPYYGDVEENGIFSSMEKVNEAKNIIVKNIRIPDYEERFDVDTIELDEMPFDQIEFTKNKKKEKKFMKAWPEDISHNYRRR